MVSEETVQSSFNKQGFMKTLGATLQSVEAGEVTITADFNEGISQQHGFFHGGVITSLADVACGYAALTLASEGDEVLTVEFKLNFLKPAHTNKLIAVGRILQAGRTLIICEGTVYNETGQHVIAKMIATMITVKKDQP